MSRGYAGCIAATMATTCLSACAPGETLQGEIEAAALVERVHTTFPAARPWLDGRSQAAISWSYRDSGALVLGGVDAAEQRGGWRRAARAVEVELPSEAG